MRRVQNFCAASLLTLMGCAHASGPSAQGRASVARYYPLAAGNRWTYAANLLGEKRTQEVEIRGFRDGFYEDNQGGHLAVDGFGLRDQKRYLLRLPLEAGKTWTNVVSASSVEHYQILGAGEPCAAPAGSFQGCVRVESRNRLDAQTTLVAELTFAPDVGIVQVKTRVETQGRSIPQAELDLQSFQVAPVQTGAGPGAPRG